MRFVYIIEDETKFQNEIAEALTGFDPKIQVRVFGSLESFVRWIKVVMQEGKAAIAKGGMPIIAKGQEANVEGDDHELSLIVSKSEFLGKNQLNLLRKTQRLFISKGICTPEDPTAFVLTAFDEGHFNIKELEDGILSNVLFKPFDRLILQQHLIFAIDGRHPPSLTTVTSQKTTAIVEMIKDVPLQNISETGFTTLSSEQIKPGVIAKYYSSHFLTQTSRSVFAKMRACTPSKTEPGLFECDFSFLGADMTLVSNLRRKLRDPKAKSETLKTSSRGESSKALKIAIVDPEETQNEGLHGQLMKRFINVQAFGYEKLSQFMADFNPAVLWREREKGLKAFSLGIQFGFLLERDSGFVAGFVGEEKPGMKLFNHPWDVLKAKPNWFLGYLKPEQKERLKKYASGRGDLSVGEVFNVTVDEQLFLIKVFGVDTKDGKKVVQFLELSEPEAVAHLEKTSPLPKDLDLLVISEKFFGTNPDQRWAPIKEDFAKRQRKFPMIALIAQKSLTTEELRKLDNWVDDVFFRPVDRVYFLQKIVHLLPATKSVTEAVEIKAFQTKEVIKVANPITVTEISEAGFVMEYYRPIPIGSFREMVLWQPYEIGAPEMLATCNYTEEIEGKKGMYSNHFVFFGAQDNKLKRIRVWILDNYVVAKQKANA